MKRPGLVAVGIALAAIAAALLYTTIAREAEYRRVMVEGENALASDQPFLAIENFSVAIALKPGSMGGYLRRGEAYRRRGRTDDLQTALRDLRKATELDPTALKPLEELGDVNFALERYARAAESYDAYLALDDHSARVLYKLALARFKLEDPATAVKKLGQAVRLNDRFAEAFYLLGVCQGQLGQTTAALASLDRVIALAPGPATLQTTREERLRLLLVLGQDAEAVTELEQLAALEPTKADHLIEAALIYARLGRTDLALAEINRALARDSGQSRVYQALGRIWLDAADPNKALEALDTAIRTPGVTSEAFTLRGRALALAGDTAGALQSFQQALQRTPVDPAAYREMASLARRRGDLALARDYLVRYSALSTDQTDADTLPEQIGVLCLRLDDKAQAVTWLRQAADGRDDSPATMTRVAAMQVRAGDRAGAATTVERGLRKTPGNPSLVALQRRLASGT